MKEEENNFNKVLNSSEKKKDKTANLVSLLVGFGARCIKMDKSGLWFGGVKFATAPLKMDIDGNFWARGNVVVESWTGTTTNATPLEIYCGSASGQRFTIKPSSVISFTLQVVARDNTSGDCAVYHFKGGIKRDGSNNTVLMATTKDTVQEDDSTWDVAVTANDTNEALKITVTGDASNTVKWAARLDGIEVSF